MDLARVAVLIPALDEEEALPGVLEALPRGIGPVVVADNGSRDRTADVARAGGARVVREDERGYGAACLAGIALLAALPTPPDVLVFLDADHSDDPGLLPLLAAPVLAGTADLVLGVRRDPARGAIGTLLPHARLGNRLVLLLARLRFGARFCDLPPYRAISFPRLLELRMDDRNWGWTLQMQLRAHLRGLRIVELEVPYRRRVQGRSKISGSLVTSVKVGLTMFRTIARERRR